MATRILVLAPALPYPIAAGGQMRMASFVNGLSEFAKVHIACISSELPPETLEWAGVLECTISCAPPIHTTPLRVWTGRIRMLLTRSNLRRHRSEARFFQEEFEKFQPDLVWLETPYLIRYALQWKERVPLVVNYWGTSEGAKRDYQNTRGIRRIWEWLRWRAARGGEKLYAPMVEDIVTVSSLDGNFFRSIAPESRIWPIPNGISRERREALDSIAREGEEGTMIMTGDLSYRPNVDAALFFVHEILPDIRLQMPSAMVRIVGCNPHPDVEALAFTPGVEVKGFVPDLADEIAKSSIYVLPMRLGSGIRSKLFDVFPLGKAIVTTYVGAEGLELTNGVNCLIEDNALLFAAACVLLLQNNLERKRLGTAVTRLTNEVYSQERVIRLLHETVSVALDSF